MFEIGALYEFRMIEGGDDVTFFGTVKEYNHPMITLEDSPTVHISMPPSKVPKSKTYPGQPGRIINVTSPNFVSAQRQQRRE